MTFTKCRLHLLANPTTHCKSRTFFWSTLYIIILFKEQVAFVPVTYASEHMKIRIIQDSYSRLQDLTVIYASELKKILNFERTHMGQKLQDGKKRLKCPDFTLTPRVALSKPFILLTWVFYPVGDLYIAPTCTRIFSFLGRQETCARKG